MAKSRAYLFAASVVGLCALHLVHSQSNVSCTPAKDAGYISLNSCELQNARTNKLRVLYIEKALTTQNSPARAAAAAKGIAYSCDKKAQALPECFVAENWKYGWVGQFMWSVFVSLNLDQNIIALTQANFTGATDPTNTTSVYKGASASTRCVWEIAIGNVDLCVGDFWETQERRGIGYFTTSFAVDRFMLVTLPEESQDTSSMFLFPQDFDADSMVNIFLPFTLNVWMVNLAMVILGGLFLWFIEACDPYTVVTMRTERPDFQGLMLSVYMALKAYWAAGQFHAPNTWAGKVVLIGMSFHFFIVMASYTASLAGFLATKVSVTGVVSDITQYDKASAQNWMGKLCMLQSAQGIVDINPDQVIGMDNYGPMFEQLYNKKCSAAVTGLNEYLLYIQGENAAFPVCANQSDPMGFASCQAGYGAARTVNLYQCTCKDSKLSAADCPEDCPDYLKYCNIIPVANQDNFQASLNWALPAGKDYVEIISQGILQRRLQGDLILARHQQLVDSTPMRCAGTSSGSSTRVNTQITVKSMLGLYIYSTGIIAIGLMLHFWQVRKALCGGKLEPHPGPSKNGSHSNLSESAPNAGGKEANDDGGELVTDAHTASRRLDGIKYRLADLSREMEALTASRATAAAAGGGGDFMPASIFSGVLGGGVPATTAGGAEGGGAKANGVNGHRNSPNGNSSQSPPHSDYGTSSGPPVVPAPGQGRPAARGAAAGRQNAVAQMPTEPREAVLNRRGNAEGAGQAGGEKAAPLHEMFITQLTGIFAFLDPHAAAGAPATANGQVNGARH